MPPDGSDNGFREFKGRTEAELATIFQWKDKLEPRIDAISQTCPRHGQRIKTLEGKMDDLRSTVKDTCDALQASAREITGVKTTLRSWGKFVFIFVALVAPLIGVVAAALTAKMMNGE